MGSALSHPTMPPSPMPHTKAGPPPRPTFLTRAHPSSPSLTTPLTSPFDDEDDETPPPPPPKKRRTSPFRREKAPTWDIGPHSTIVNLERGRSSTWGGPGKGYVKTLDEDRERKMKGRWANRMKVHEDGEMWFY